MPVPMRPNDNGRPARYHRGHLDTDWQSDLILPWQRKAYYQQPYELGDPFRFQLKATPLFSHALQLVNCSWKTLYTFSVTDTEAVSGDLDANGAQYTTYHYAINNWLALTPDLGYQLPEGTYYLVYRISYDGTLQYVYVSEPIDIRASHPDTALIEYWHNTYTAGIPFPLVPAKFRLRVQAFVDNYVPKSISTVYQNQNSDTQTLDYAPYRAWSLNVGKTQRRQVGGIADWMLDKLNRILGMDNLYIDGKRYSASTANPSWNIETAPTTPLKVATVEIQEAVDAEDFTFAETSFQLFATGTYPYVIGHISIGGFAAVGTTRIANSTVETSTIAAWNAALPAAELTGAITKVGSAVYYNNGPGERYTFADITRFTVKFSFGYTLLSAGSLSMTIGGGNPVISWGDGGIQEVDATAPTLFTHNYGGAGAMTVEVWGGVDYFAMSQSGTSGLTGTIPPGMATLIVNLMTFTSNTFDFALLSNCRTALRMLVVTNGGLTAANNMPSYQFPILAHVQFNSNALGNTVMNLLIADVKNNAYNNSIFNGILNVGSQTPPATLNPIGTTAKAALQVYGWAVTN